MLLWVIWLITIQSHIDILWLMIKGWVSQPFLWVSVMSHYVYIIECINGSYYTGYTTDVERRYKEHLKGSGKCKYTRSFPPKCLAAFWQFADKTEALAAEYQIKSLAKCEKLVLIERWQSENAKS